MIDSDDDLRGRFTRFREEERARGPSFGTVRARTPRAPSRPTMLLSGLAAAAAAVALIAYGAIRVLGPSGPGAPPTPVTVAPLQAVLVSARWTSPTDFLLDVPGASLLRTVPTFGRAMQSLMPRSLAPGGRPRDSVRPERGA